MTDEQFIDFVLNKRPWYVSLSYPERMYLYDIYQKLTGLGATISGLNRLRTKVPPDIAQRILTLTTDLIQWEGANAGSSSRSAEAE